MTRNRKVLGVETDDALLEINAENNFIHISFDDVEYCFIDLKNNINTYSTIFDNV